MKPRKKFVALDKKLHDRKKFDCGKARLNQFFRENARRGMDARVSYTWVLPAAGTPKGTLKPVCAWYTLSLCSIERETLPSDLAQPLPQYPIPVLILAQLAVDQNCQGQGLGNVTLIQTLRHCASLSQQGKVPAAAIILDVVDEDAMAFYRRFSDFRLLPTIHAEMLPRLYLPIKVAEQLGFHI